MIPVPAKLRKRPYQRGFPVPFVALRGRDGSYDFRVVDEAKRNRTRDGRLCQLCGQSLGSFLYFVGGPPSVEHMAFFEPPLHLECLVYAFQVCPFILGQKEHANPSAVAMKHTDKHVVATAMKREPCWIVVKSTAFEIVMNGGAWNFRPKDVRYVSPELFPEKMTAQDWKQYSDELRATIK